MNTQDILLVFSTCPDLATAQRLGRALVEQSLAACVNVVPGIRSLYVWNDAVRDEPEVLLVLKTAADRFEDLRTRLVELHPYEVPEVVAVRAADGHDAYLRWVAAATRTPQPT
jgi:periplasmic divalent cation tolerance protein